MWHDHNYGMDILRLCKDHNRTEAVTALKWVYEATPCSLCRSHAVAELAKGNFLSPDQMEEIRHDCAVQTRQVWQDS